MASTAMDLGQDYAERVYAGVLGKIIGVYLGRPFEQWPHEKIERELGEINYYVHEQCGVPLVVTDDDITGTFTFLRALSENGNDPTITPAQIGDWWRNIIIENRTILWWGGLNVSTEHTAFLRLQAGIAAPESGSEALNGKQVAEEIGAQIFIDGWGLICPNDPARAADFARQAASVSHDGEAIYGAQVVAALVAQAFTETDLGVMLDNAAALIPLGSLIAETIADVREWAADNGDDWRATLRAIHAKYPYERFGTNCPMVSNHAVVLLALLHGNGDFQRTLMIAGTAGYDTDCNAGNAGCIVGVWKGLAGINSGPDWRGPIADRLFLPTADGGQAITDALRETYAIVNIGRALAGQPPMQPKGGARFHFSLLGSVQGFVPDEAADARGVVTLSNTDGRLTLQIKHLAAGRAARISTATFTPPEALQMGGYELVASPALYPGQTITARVEASAALSAPVRVGLYIGVYDTQDALSLQRGPTWTLLPGTSAILEYTVPDTGGQPVAQVGLEARGEGGIGGALFLDSLTWNGTPTMTLGRPAGGNVWERAWVNGASSFSGSWASMGWTYRMVQNAGVGLVTQGEWRWTNYTVSVDVLPHHAEQIALLACVRGLRRYVALLLDGEDGRIRLVQQHDNTRRVLAESGAAFTPEAPLSLSITVCGGHITGHAGETTLTAQGDTLPGRGAIGLLVGVGHAEFGPARVTPASV